MPDLNPGCSEKELLLKEYSTLREEVNLLSGYVLKGFTWFYAGLGAAVLWAKREQLDMIYVFIPLFMLIVNAYAMRQRVAWLSLCAYTAEIETRLNALVGRKAMLWESVVRKKVGGKEMLYDFFFIAPQVIIYLYCVVVGYLYLADSRPAWAILVVMFYLLVASIMLVLVFNLQKEIEAATKDAVRDHLGEQGCATQHPD